MTGKAIKTYTFQGVLETLAGKWGHSFVTVPYDVNTEFGTNGTVRIKGTLNGIPIDRALIPRGDGTHYIIVNTELRRLAGLRAGNKVAISFVRNTDPDQIDIPEELEAGFEIEPGARELFHAHKTGLKRSVVYWISSAKTPATREKRAVEMLRRIVAGTLTTHGKKAE